MAPSLSGFVRGVFVEVLWDVETFNAEGRREGQRITESIWWRGEVCEVRQEGVQTFAKIRYDAMGTFESQFGEVRVFPFHLQPVDVTDMTQIRWRYYESSGDVRYNAISDGTGRDDTVYGACSAANDGHDMQLAVLTQTVDQLVCRVDQVNRLYVSERETISRISGQASSTDRCCDRLFGLLRHKLAIVLQKPLLPYKKMHETNEPSTRFDFSCAGSIRADVDCNIEEFETVSCAVKASSPASHFRADGRAWVPCSGSLPAVLGTAEILFQSLSALCRALGICHERDVMNIAKRERNAGKNNRVEDPAVRLAGSFLVHNGDSNTPTAILVCRSVHAGLSGDEEIAVLTRDSQELDQRTVWYRHPLRSQKMNPSALFKYVYPSVHGSLSDRSRRDLIHTVTSESGCFSLRWRPLLNPNGKIWSRSMLLRPDFAGSLEVEIPYVLIRGKTGTDEINELVSLTHLKGQLEVLNST